MDLTAHALDIEELVEAFASMGGTELVQMKELWRCRSFSFIHEARPKDVIAPFYSQGLFSSALCHIVDDVYLSRKLGGLYVLYALHGTQQEPSCYRIYLSLEELEALLSLVKEIKKNRLATALKVVRKMFAEHVFLFGSVSANQKRIAASVSKLARQANARVQQARFRLLTDVPIEQHLGGHLGQELGLDQLPQLTEEYAAAKALAFSNEQEDVGDPGLHGGEPAESTLGIALVEDADTWDAHKDELLTRMKQHASELRNSADVAGVSLKRGNAGGKSRGGKQLKTVTEYERELSDRDLERELLDQLDEVLDE